MKINPGIFALNTFCMTHIHCVHKVFLPPPLYEVKYPIRSCVNSIKFETILKFFLPRCLEDVVEDDDDEVVLALVASNPNFAAAAAITA